MILQEWCALHRTEPELRIEGGCTVMVVPDGHAGRMDLWHLTDFYVNAFTDWTVYLRPVPDYYPPVQYESGGIAVNGWGMLR